MDKKISFGYLIIPFLLILLYGMLSYLAFFNQVFFFESMNMPIPNHDFLIWSWGGKNTAIVVALVGMTFLRSKQGLLVILLALIVMQLGDINAGLRTNVDVNLTYLGLALVLIEIVILLFLKKEKL